MNTSGIDGKCVSLRKEENFNEIVIKPILCKLLCCEKIAPIYWAAAGQYFSRNGYGLIEGELNTCKGTFRPVSRDMPRTIYQHATTQ